jgi:hypothetical protein
MTALCLVALIATFSCQSNDDDDVTGGTLVFTANGETFARDGFTSKDGWSITFDHAFLSLGGPTAFQVPEDGGGSTKPDLSRHAGHPHVGLTGGGAHVALPGTYVVDVAQSADTDYGTALAFIAAVEPGNYNRVAWDLKVCDGQTATAVGSVTPEDMAMLHGYSLVLVGTAVKAAVTKDFVLRFRDAVYWVSAESHPLDIGVVSVGGTGFAEMTFHFDHIFGDASVSPTDELNLAAVGFDPFAAIDPDSDSDLYVDDDEMGRFMPAATCKKFYRAFLTLGHTGEAHCMFMPGGSGVGAEAEAPTEPDYPVGATGTLEFLADGEDFARLGFTSRDGWAITCSHVYVCLKNPKAYRLPVDATDAGGEEELTGAFVVDIAQGSAATKVGEAAAVAVGHYARVSWELKDIETTDTPISPVTAGDLTGLVGGGTGCMILTGTAVKAAATIHFTLRIHDPMAYMAAEAHPDGLGRLTTSGGTAQAYMTFHLDHIFGDLDTLDEWDSPNPGALGFDSIAALDNTAGDADLTVGTVDLDLDALAAMGAADLLTFYKAWLTLGHCGEGHCFASLGAE